eukprot:TRINITY_DN19589_c0_g1_i1.p1 TRINITY_DN19589_c0_g1~~TRINITY_DN19589_c0_g1_i1.p1  ORF type:complete len:282 (-),score=109.86 TRINITY_DN19589_c0_g1_i1:66-911(-)
MDSQTGDRSPGGTAKDKKAKKEKKSKADKKVQKQKLKKSDDDLPFAASDRPRSPSSAHSSPGSSPKLTERATPRPSPPPEPRNGTVRSPLDSGGSSMRSSPSVGTHQRAANLLEAAAMGDLEQARAMRQQGFGVNGVDDNGWSALHHAAACGHLELVRFLVADGANTSIPDSTGATAFDRAVAGRHLDVCAYLDSLQRNPPSSPATSPGPVPAVTGLSRKEKTSSGAFMNIFRKMTFQDKKDSASESDVSQPQTPRGSVTLASPPLARTGSVGDFADQKYK